MDGMPPAPIQTVSLVLSAVVLACFGCGDRRVDPPAAVSPPAVASTRAVEAVLETPPAPRPPSGKPPKARRDDGLVADNGRTLWASPTAGEPIDLSTVPDASGLVLHLRPAALLATAEGAKAWRALGPAGDTAREDLEAAAGRPLNETDALVVGVTAGESYQQVATTLSFDPAPSDELPLLQREIELLIETTDRDRHLTLVFSPRFLLGDGGSLLRGPWAPLRELLLAQMRDSWKAAALSLHLDDAGRLYWELRVLGTAAEPERRVARSLAERAAGWEDELAATVEGGDWAPYSRAVVERSPAMIEVVARYARRGVEGRQAVLNGYAPPGAAHQLLLAAERIVAEFSDDSRRRLLAESTAEANDAALSVEERLRQPVTVRFARESLETAVGILSDAMAVPITIRGRDLQLEGITRNQMLGLDVAEQTAEAALVEALRLANPDPLATGPADDRQRLVYLVRDGRIELTTRQAAESRGDPLPAVFVE